MGSFAWFFRSGFSVDCWTRHFFLFSRVVFSFSFAKKKNVFPTKESRKKLIVRTANGRGIQHYGGETRIELVSSARSLTSASFCFPSAGWRKKEQRRIGEDESYIMNKGDEGEDPGREERGRVCD